MAENTAISWADDTFNPWIGCTKVSPACDGCYAENLMANRLGRVEWGGERVRTSAANWAKPLQWEREQARLWAEFEMCFADVPGTIPPRPRFVFCASLADVFDNQVPAEWRRDLFDLIRKTPHLTWLVLTKRPGNIVTLFGETLGWEADKKEDVIHRQWPFNAAIGCTGVTQEEADRDIPKLLAAKAALNPAFAFVSLEPLLGPVDLTRLTPRSNGEGGTVWSNVLAGHTVEAACDDDPHDVDFLEDHPRLDWVITGGETDQGEHKARPSHPDWFRMLRDQCAAAGVPFHHKQNGEWLHRPELIDAGGPSAHRFTDGAWMDKVGKKAAGRLLDGVAHDARPEAPR